MKLNQKLAKKVLAVALTLAMVVTSLFVMPTTANAATGATIGRYASVKAGTTNVTTVKNLGKNYYAKVSVTGTAKNGVTITRVNGNKVKATTKIQGTGNNIKLNVKNWNVPGKNYVLTVKTYNKKTNKLVRTYTAKSTFVYKTLTKVTLDETAEVLVGGTVTLKAVKTPTTATNKLTWSSSDETVATVNAGVVTGVKAGEATITVKSSNGKTATCKITVKENLAVMTNLEATGAKKLTMTLSATADIKAADVTVKKGAATPNVSDVTVTDKTAVVTLGSKMTAGTYSLTYNGVTKEVTVLDETLTTLAPVGTNLAETVKGVVGNNYKSTATIAFSALNQYGEKMLMPGNATATCTFGTTNVTKTPTTSANGEITVSDITSTLAIVGTAGSLVLVDSKTGVSSTTAITYSAAATTSTIEVKGVYNKSTGKFVDMKRGDTASQFALVFVAKDQYGNELNAKKLIADAANVTLTATPILSNVTIAGATFTTTNIDTVTIDGTEYTALCFTNAAAGSIYAAAGSTTVTIVNNTKGMLLNTSYTIGDGVVIKSVSVSAADGIYAEEGNYLDYEVVDADGKTVTDYDTLNSCVEFTQTTGEIKWVKQSNGNAKLLYTPNPTSYAAGSKYSQANTVTITSNKSTPAKMVVTTATLNVYTARKATTISGISKSFTSACVLNDSVKLALSSLVIEDQYGNAMKSTMHDYPTAASIQIMLANDAGSTAFTKIDDGGVTTVKTKALNATGLNQNYTGAYKLPAGNTAGSATVYVKLGTTAVEAANADYSFKIYAVDSKNATDLKIAYVNWGSDWEVAANDAKSGLTTGDIQVTGNVGGKTVYLPTSQYVITNDTYAKITTAEGQTSKTAKVEVTVDTKDGTKDITTVLTSDYTYSNKDRTLVYMARNISREYTGAFNYSVTSGEVTALDLARGLYTEDQYGNMDTAMSGIKYTVAKVSGNVTSITHNSTNKVVIKGSGIVVLSVTATGADTDVTQEITFNIDNSAVTRAKDLMTNVSTSALYATVDEAINALYAANEYNTPDGCAFVVTNIVVKTDWLANAVTVTATFADGTKVDYIFDNVVAKDDEALAALVELDRAALNQATFTGATYATVAAAQAAIEAKDTVDTVEIKTAWAVSSVTFTITYLDGTTEDLTCTNVTAAN